MTQPPNLDKGQPDDGQRWTDQAVPPTAPYSGPGQPAYPPNPYAAQPFGGFGFAPPDHPQSTTILILGIVGIVVCQVTAPFAWVMGKRALEEIDHSGGQIGGRSQVQAGYVLGIVGSVILGIGVLLGLVYLVLIIAVFAGASSG